MTIGRDPSELADASGFALVVGGASGIGAACAASLRTAGRQVVIADRTAAPEGFEGVQLDVRDREAAADAVSEVVARFGKIGVVVFAAGTARVTPILDIDQKEWDLVLGVNLTGAFNLLQASAPHLIAGGGGSFIAISSIDSQAPVKGLAHYCASKAGVEALVRSAALELGSKGVRCNAVLPGLVRTPLMAPQLERDGVEEAFVRQTPLAGIASPSEIADVVTFLASPAARWVTGAALPVDGGMALTEHPRLGNS